MCVWVFCFVFIADCDDGYRENRFVKNTNEFFFVKDV